MTFNELEGWPNFCSQRPKYTETNLRAIEAEKVVAATALSGTRPLLVGATRSAGRGSHNVRTEPKGLLACVPEPLCKGYLWTVVELSRMLLIWQWLSWTG
eukprot:6486111-Amphidinium_carterae.2